MRGDGHVRRWVRRRLLNWVWWATLPVTMLMVAAVSVQMLARLAAWALKGLDEGIEVVFGAINAPVHAWWKASVKRIDRRSRG